MSKRKSFKLRAFISIYMAITSILIVISGIILYIAPPGRIAHWSYWSMLGLTKDEWQALHIIFTFIIVLAGILHIIYNWKPLVSYLLNKVSGVTSIRMELTFSVLLSLIIFLGTYYEVPPFSTVIDFGEDITDSWSDESNEPPIPHAEEFTISELAQQLNMNTEKVVMKLEKIGYPVSDTTVTLKELAEKYNVVPSEIYNAVSTGSQMQSNQNSSINNSGSSSYRPGSGYGRKKLSEIFEENNLTWEEGIEKLAKRNIRVSEDGKLKDIASENDKLPIDIIDALELGK